VEEENGRPHGHSIRGPFYLFLNIFFPEIDIAGYGLTTYVRNSTSTYLSTAGRPQFLSYHIHHRDFGG